MLSTTGKCTWCNQVYQEVTFADTTPLEQDFGFRPSTPLRAGLRAFAQWYAGYYGVCE